MLGNLENGVAQGADCLKGYAEQFAEDRMQGPPEQSAVCQADVNSRSTSRIQSDDESLLSSSSFSPIAGSVPLTQLESRDSYPSEGLSVSSYFRPKIRNSRPVAPIDLEYDFRRTTRFP